MTKLGLYEWSEKNEFKIYISNIYFYIFSRATLNETFTAKYDGKLQSRVRGLLWRIVIG